MSSLKKIILLTSFIMLIATIFIKALSEFYKASLSSDNPDKVKIKIYPKNFENCYFKIFCAEKERILVSNIPYLI